MDHNTETPHRDDRYHLTGIKLAMVVSAVTMVTFLIFLDVSIIVTAIPKTTAQFHSLEDLGWYGSSYQIAGACLQPLTGQIYLKYNSKWTYLGFFFVFELGSLLCGLARSSKMLIIARAVAGLGSSGLVVGSLTIVSASVPLAKSPPLIRIMMGLAQLGTVLGPLLGGAFTQYSSWRWCFYVNLPIGAIIALLMAFIHIPEAVDKPERVRVRTANKWFHVLRALGTESSPFRKLDLIGFGLLAPAAIQLLLALYYGAHGHGWKSATPIGLFIGAGMTTVLFLLWEQRKEDKAMIPLAMVRKRIIWSSCLTQFSLFAMTLSASFYLPVYFQAVNNVSPMMSGIYLLPIILSQLLFAVISGVCVGKLGYYLPWAIFAQVVGSIGTGLISTFDSRISMDKWIGYQIIAGTGEGCGFQMPIIAIQNTLPKEEVPLGMSVMMFFRTMSGAVVFSIFDVIFSSGLTSLIPKDAPGVDPQHIIAAGATGIRNVVSAQDLPGLLTAYALSIDYVFYLAAALGGLGVFFASGMGWKDIRPPTENDELSLEITAEQPAQEMKTMRTSETSQC